MGAARAWYELVILEKDVPEKLILYTENWLQWLIKFTRDSGGITPSFFPMETAPEPIEWDFTAHMAGPWLAGACYAKLAGSQLPGLDDFIEASVKEILDNQINLPYDQIMNGSWSSEVREETGEGAACNGVFYGYWSGEILRGLAMYLLAKRLSPGESIYTEYEMSSHYPPYLLASPIAQNGNRTIPPHLSQAAGTGRLSQDRGWQAVNAEPIGQGGIPPKREDFNGVLYLLSQLLFWYQQGGIMKYTGELDYEVGNEVMYQDKKFRCIYTNGPSTKKVTPGTNAQVWRNMDAAVPAGTVQAFANVSLGGSDGRRPVFWGETDANEGWVLADGGDDGLGGTVPDLVGRFVLGSTVQESGQTGGSNSATTASTSISGTIGSTVLTVDHLPSHTHSGEATSAGGHTHTRGSMEITGAFASYEMGRFGSTTTEGAFYTAGSWFRGTSGHNGSAPLFRFQASRSWSGETSSSGAHTHTVSVSSTGGGKGHTHTLTGKAHQHTVSVPNPPFYKLAYFVKLPE